MLLTGREGHSFANRRNSGKLRCGLGMLLTGREGHSFANRRNSGNFVRAAPMATLMVLVVWATGQPHASWSGLELAMISGAITSGLGYAIWYTALKDLSTSRAAIVQLTVPVITAVAGVIFLGEQMTWRLVLAAVSILGGVALALLGNRQAVSPPKE